jgi:hypothetical protein
MVTMWDIALSVLLIASVLFLLYELRRFGVLHARKYEIPTEKIWEKFVGIRPEEMTESGLPEKIQHLENKIAGIEQRIDKQNKLTKKLIEELGK